MTIARHLLCAAAALTTIALAAPAIAQDLGEVVVTASRSDGNYYSDEKTVIGLRRPADNAVQQVWIVSDSRDADMRCKEVLSMLDAAMARAGGAGVQLVDGDFELKPINRAEYTCKSMSNAGRPDTSQIGFYVKAPVTGGTAPDVAPTTDSATNAITVSGPSCRIRSSSACAARAA